MNRVTHVIARVEGAPYLRVMGKALFRLLTAIALFLMPFGMAAGPALAAAAPAAASHCDEHPQPAEGPAPAQAHCTGCSALPALAAPAAVAEVLPKEVRLLTRTEAVSDTEPETATPPPKLG